ncbi:LuxR C-terminal-related transcriptional regulator [Gordonia sp. DT30]|uniref:helix-turn-helix transcriptional regulator n=1 Tax=Gordonia sp. DT30 TaxID=3416546 RepID=UPI003CE96E88
MLVPTTRRPSMIADIAAAVEGGMNDSAASSVVVLSGGPGMGKTHTLHRLMDTVTGPARFTCADELSWRMPYAVAAALLGAEITSAPEPGFGDTLLGLVDEMCSAGPLLLVVDDAHHADAASLELLGRLADATADLPLTLLLGRRLLPRRDLLERLVARSSTREWALPPMDGADLAALALDVAGAPVDEHLTALLESAGGNPMHAIALLNDLRRTGELTIVDGVATTTGTDRCAADTETMIAEHLALLDPRAADLTGKLAVWGAPATLSELASIESVRPVTLVAAAQTAIDAGILAIDAAGRLSFTHDLYGDVGYQMLAAPLRTVLHEAIAEQARAHGDHHLLAHHLLAAGRIGPDTLNAVRAAEAQLAHAPAVTVDLFESVGRASTPGASPAPGWHLGLATALARTGQLSRASEVAAEGVAAEGITATADIAELAALLRVRLFALIARGRTDDARALIAETLALPVDDDARAALTDSRDYLGILEGRGPVPSAPFHDAATGPDRSVTGIAAEALRRYLRGEGLDALALAIEATRREGEQSGPTAAHTSAVVWPPLIEQHTHGPSAALALLESATRTRSARGADWMTAYHDFTRGGIELALGRLDDSAASFDTGFERVAAADMGWTSMAHAGRATVDILRGDFAAAAARLDAFSASGLPDQFGIPLITATRAHLLESRRRLRPAAQEATRTWRRAHDMQLYGWLPSSVLLLTRIAVRAGAADLLDALRSDIAEIPRPLPPAATHVELAAAVCAVALDDADPQAVVTAGVAAADAAHTVGDVLAEASACEEAACAAAALGDKHTARDLAIRALSRTQDAGATTDSARLATRLRALGLRMDPNTVRHRPTHGWDSLTATEITVAELIGDGQSGAEIAERLYISPRTVQTHVSHALTKLGLRTRVELAAQVAARRHPADPRA